jgi:mRNA interferase HigB
MLTSLFAFCYYRIVNVISMRGLGLLLKGKSRDISEEVADWFKSATAARWDNIQDVRLTFPDADLVGQVLVFNIRHNRYRLIATVFFPSRTIYVKALLTHKEYDREEWKKWVQRH